MIIQRAVIRLDDTDLKTIALKYGVVIIKYITGEKKTNTPNQQYFVSSVRKAIYHEPIDPNLEPIIKDYIFVALAILRNLRVSEVRYLNNKMKSAFRLPFKQQKSFKSKAVIEYLQNQTSRSYQNKLESSNKANAEIIEPNPPVVEIIDPKQVVEERKSSKYYNRPLPSNGFVLGKLDPNQIKTIPDDRQDWKKIRNSRF